MKQTENIRSETRKLSLRCGGFGLIALAGAYFAAPYGPRIAEGVGVASEWRVWALVASGLPFLMAASTGSRIHGLRDVGAERGSKILEIHRRALALALVAMIVGAAWVYAVGVTVGDDWLPLIVGGMAWLGQSLRVTVAIRRWEREISS